MSQRPALVVGASGLVGAYLLRSFGREGEAVGTAHEQDVPGLVALDIRDLATARELVRELCPRIVLCTAAVSNVELCEREPAAARAVNVDATLALAGAAREAGATFVFLSSEYVFDGEHGPYAEEAATSPINEYGRQKAEVEEPLPGITGGDYLVARVSCVYGHERRRKNFAYQLQAALSQGCELRVPGDQLGTPTYAPNAADMILELVRAGERGVFHVAGADRMLRSDFARIAAEELGLDPALVVATPTQELGLVAPRPKGAGLLVDKSAAAVSTPLIGIREGIRHMLAEGPLASPTASA